MPVCQCCQQRQSKFLCPGCIQEGFASHDAISRTLTDQLYSAKEKARRRSEAPTGVTAWRRLRAEVAATESRIDALQRRIEACRSETMAARRLIQSRHRQPCRNMPPEAPYPSPTNLSKFIVPARGVLVREAVSTFGLRARSTGEWEIAGLVLPDIRDLQGASSSLVNAALLHTIHLLSLIKHYLSVSLPFEPQTQTLRPHMGRPFISANIPFVPTTKFHDKHILWMSSGSAKKINPSPKAIAKQRSFLVSFALLAHSVAYLAWSQGVQGIGVNPEIADSEDESESPESAVTIPATNILQLLAETAESPLLGIKSHEPGSTLLRDLGFGLDVRVVVESVLRGEVHQAHETRNLQDDWDVIPIPRSL